MHKWFLQSGGSVGSTVVVVGGPVVVGGGAVVGPLVVVVVVGGMVVGSTGFASGGTNWHSSYVSKITSSKATYPFPLLPRSTAN